MTWLVVGGAGYIGSHVVRHLRAEGLPVVVLDNLSTGMATRIPPDVPLVVGADTDRRTVARTLRTHHVDGVVHLAAVKSVPESVEDPLRYYGHNVDGLRVLLEAMVDAGVSRILFSSSAAVYGMPRQPKVTEDTPAAPINPYGETKLVCEWMLRAAGAAHDISWIALRYFNVVGSEDAQLAERNGSGLFPKLFQNISTGRPVVITGADYPTRDGTGVRDYVHVTDIADAHAAAVRRLQRGPIAEVYNVGTGKGHSVLEVIAAVRDETGLAVPVTAGPRRAGDPPEVVAAVDKIRRDLAWRARHGMSEMVRSAWRSWAAGPKPDASVAVAAGTPPRPRRAVTRNPQRLGESSPSAR
ncbi:UDP-glucose 4-epimerase GalE [Planosporangium sp. 12N6]|uniref:UDP-glucose 4-epimerase GalE n=1 Tax=Planosporangium spinosum TaxID=3402278 RepID=UPI003CF55C57